MVSDISGWIARMLEEEGLDSIDYLASQDMWADFSSKYLTAFTAGGQENQFQALMEGRYTVLSEATKEWGFTLRENPSNPMILQAVDMSSGRYISWDTAKEMAGEFLGF